MYLNMRGVRVVIPSIR